MCFQDGTAIPVLAPEVLCTADRANEPVDGYAQNAAPARFDTPSPAERALASEAPTLDSEGHIHTRIAGHQNSLMHWERPQVHMATGEVVEGSNVH